MNLTINEPELQALKDRLAEKYPPYHWNHVEVFSKFWALVATTNDK